MRFIAICAVALVACSGASADGNEPVGDAPDAMADDTMVDDAFVVDNDTGRDDGPPDSPAMADVADATDARPPPPAGDATADTTVGLCTGFATTPFEPPKTCTGPTKSLTAEIPTNRIYAASAFGCYRKADGTIYKDPADNCEFACGPKGYCPATQPGPECEANLKWFAADSDRYTCGGKIRVTNCANGKSVVLVTLDRGPNCTTVEQKYGAPVLDMSYPAMLLLFDGKIYGASDRKRVVVEAVPATTPLGPG